MQQTSTLRNFHVLLLLGVLGFSACQSVEKKSTGANDPPIVLSADFFPAVLQEGQSVVVKAYGKDPEGDAISFQFEWFVNKKPVHHERELPASFLKRGDRVAVKITPNDGMSDGTPLKTAVAIVQNIPPEIVSIQLRPRPFHPGETIRAVVAGKDNEGDTIQYSYEWRKNGLPLFSEDQDHLKTSNLKKGDIITVYITPHDGRDAGKPVESLQLASNNRQPEITSNPSLQFSNGVYSYPIIAADPDGDLLQYAIQDPRPGMRLEQNTGLFEWDIPANETGVQYVTLVVRDTEGSGTAQKVRLDIDFLRNNAQ